jgi:hypothetical protein
MALVLEPLAVCKWQTKEDERAIEQWCWCYRETSKPDLAQVLGLFAPTKVIQRVLRHWLEKPKKK